MITIAIKTQQTMMNKRKDNTTTQFIVTESKTINNSYVLRNVSFVQHFLIIEPSHILSVVKRSIL